MSFLLCQTCTQPVLHWFICFSDFEFVVFWACLCRRLTLCVRRITRYNIKGRDKIFMTSKRRKGEEMAVSQVITWCGRECNYVQRMPKNLFNKMTRACHSFWTVSLRLRTTACGARESVPTRHQEFLISHKTRKCAEPSSLCYMNADVSFAAQRGTSRN